MRTYHDPEDHTLSTHNFEQEMEHADRLHDEIRDREAERRMELTDTADTIRPTTPEEDAHYAAIGEEIKEDATAILATSRFMLTGYEEQVCEHASGIDNGMFGVDMDCLDRLRTELSREISQYKNNR